MAGTYLLRRVLLAVPVLFAISLIAFLIVHLAPGDPAALLVNVEQLTDEELQAVHRSLGLDDPLPVKYVKTMGALLTGRLVSFNTSQTTLAMVQDSLPLTAALIGGSILVGVLLGVPLGVVSALRPYGVLDNALTVVALLGVSIPQFWLGLLLILVFAETLGLLPASGLGPLGSAAASPLEVARHLVLPVTVLGSVTLPPIVRYTRSAMLEALAQDYVRTARGKGLPELVVVAKHALRNSLLAVVTLVGMLVPILLGASVVVEYVFALPGIGSLAINAALARDYPVVITVNFMAAVIALAAGLLVDLAYGVLDPRLRHA